MEADQEEEELREKLKQTKQADRPQKPRFSNFPVAESFAENSQEEDKKVEKYHEQMQELELNLEKQRQVGN